MAIVTPVKESKSRDDKIKIIKDIQIDIKKLLVNAEIYDPLIMPKYYFLDFTEWTIENRLLTIS